MPAEMTATETAGNRFDITAASALFENALLGSSSDVSLPMYVDAYRHLNNFFLLFGRGFSFIEKDLVEKENILADLQAFDSEHYGTVKNMIAWEFRTGKPSEKGSRTLLRLHRALLFIADFLKNLKDSSEGDQVSAICQASYDHTLSKHHTWFIRKCVNVAIHLLASRKSMLNAIINERGPRNEEEVRRAIARLVNAMEKVYSCVQEIYERKNILDLP